MINNIVAIVDRSTLAHNVYKMLLKPYGYRLSYYKTLRDLKEGFHPKGSKPVLLISSNAFGNHFERHLEWLQNEASVRWTPKVFLCLSDEKKIIAQLKKVPRSHLVLRPFFPPVLKKTLDTFWKERS